VSARAILVTGGAQGIGRAIALRFAGIGWRVAVLDRDAEALDELRALIPADALLAVQADTGEENDVTRAFGELAEWLGETPLACLVNNAAIADPYCGPLEELALSDWQAWIDACLTGAFLCSRAAIPLLRAHHEASGEAASIVNISSTRAVMSEPESFAYAASKGGLDALTHAMAVSLGPAIRVNAIRPGWIETRDWQKEAEREEVEHRPQDREQHPAGRVGRPEDIAEAVEYLVGAGFVTGQHLNVDGGMTVKMIYEE
jgi:NAD(P)-dependent dehydrogenase (short-subunit alcohol dehydrogenase family)